MMHSPSPMSHDSNDNHKHIDDLADHVGEMDLHHHQTQASPRHGSRTPSAPQSPSHRSNVSFEDDNLPPRNGLEHGHKPVTPIRTPIKSPLKSPIDHDEYQNSQIGLQFDPLVPRNTKFAGSKMHMGLKNLSSGVHLAVSPNNKMEFNQDTDEGFGPVKINRPIKNHYEKHETDSIMSHDSHGSKLTDHGHFDLKYYHNRLW